VLPILSTLQKQVTSSPTMAGQWNVIAVMETVMTRPLARVVYQQLCPQDPSGTAATRRR
jgi:hypothetical protein